MLYNLIQVVRGYIASGRAEVVATEELSGEQIFYDMRRQLVALSELVERPGAGGVRGSVVGPRGVVRVAGAAPGRVVDRSAGRRR